MLQSRFIDFIKTKTLFVPSNKLLLGISGGIDSMVMLHLLEKLGYDVLVAHCNFKLRGEESDGDALFVRSYCREHSIRYFEKSFQTEAYSKKSKLSIEMAARNLRYNWFRELKEEHNCQVICVAHHADDSIETFHINLLRGTGIHGLTGIKPQNGDVVRPLLFAFREEIKNYASQYAISYREDSSNNEDFYLRNKFRLNIIPEFERLNPSYKKGLLQTIKNLMEAEEILNTAINDKKKDLIFYKGDAMCIKLPELIAQKKNQHFILHEILFPLGFNDDAVNNIAQDLHRQAGKIWLSASHKLIKDRDTLRILPFQHVKDDIIYISEMDTIIQLEGNSGIKMDVKKISSAFQFSKSNTIACLDKEKLKFPLSLRHWKPGDHFYPLGLKKRKKLSDFFIDLKIPRDEKDKIWLLCSGEEICWIMGKRIDERFKVTEITREVIIFELYH